MKDYHINIFDGKPISVTRDINRKGTDYMFPDIENAWKKRYIISKGDSVIDIFGNLVTIKEVLHHEETCTTNFLVEENENCYCPNEIAGLFIKYLTDEELSNLVEHTNG